MKKIMKLLMILIIFFSIFISGCGEEKPSGKEESSKEIPDNITIFGGSVGGVWSVFTEGVSEAVRKEYPGTLISAVPGTVFGNPVSVSQGKTGFAISESLTAFFAYKGHAPFEEELRNVRAVASLIPENTFQLVAPESAPFNSVPEIAENNYPIRYSAGEKGALGDIVSAAVFEAYDLTYEDIQVNGGEVNFLSGGKTFELMADSKIDSLGKMVPIPAGDIMEASATIDLKFIPIGEKAVDHLIQKFDMKPFTIEAGSYEFQDEDYLTVKTPTILITNEEMDEETVYQVTKAIYNQLDYLKDVHKGFRSLNNETIADVGAIPLHPGAERFYKEIELMD